MILPSSSSGNSSRSKVDAADRWALALAGLLGDDRYRAAIEPADPSMGRQQPWQDGEYAVQALSLLGTDLALRTIDALAIRYRAKNKNVGRRRSTHLRLPLRTSESRPTSWAIGSSPGWVSSRARNGYRLRRQEGRGSDQHRSQAPIHRPGEEQADRLAAQNGSEGSPR